MCIFSLLALDAVSVVPCILAVYVHWHTVSSWVWWINHILELVSTWWTYFLWSSLTLFSISWSWVIGLTEVTLTVIGVELAVVDGSLHTFSIQNILSFRTCVSTGTCASFAIYKHKTWFAVSTVSRVINIDTVRYFFNTSIVDQLESLRLYTCATYPRVGKDSAVSNSRDTLVILDNVAMWAGNTDSFGTNCNCFSAASSYHGSVSATPTCKIKSKAVLTYSAG